MEKGWEQIVAVLGILASGAAYLPIDPELPKERLWYLLENGEVQQVLTQSWLNETLELPDEIQRIAVDSDELASENDRPLEPVNTPEDLAYVIYTSGSTGFPKGVVIAHRGAVNAIVYTNRRFDIRSTDRVLALTALHHDMSVFDIFGILAAGGTIVIPEASARLDPAHWIQLMLNQRVTLWNSVPAMMEMFVEYAEGQLQSTPIAEVNPRLDPPQPPFLRGEKMAGLALRLAFLGGDWIAIALPNRIKVLAESIQVISVG